MEKLSEQLQTTVLNVSINIAQHMSMQIIIIIIIIIIIMLSKTEIVYYFKIWIILNKSVTWHMILQKSYTYSREVFKTQFLMLKLINIFLKAVILF